MNKYRIVKNALGEYGLQAFRNGQWEQENLGPASNWYERFWSNNLAEVRKTLERLLAYEASALEAAAREQGRNTIVEVVE